MPPRSRTLGAAKKPKTPQRKQSTRKQRYEVYVQDGVFIKGPPFPPHTVPPVGALSETKSGEVEKRCSCNHWAKWENFDNGKTTCNTCLEKRKRVNRKLSHMKTHWVPGDTRAANTAEEMVTIVTKEHPAFDISDPPALVISWQTGRRHGDCC